MEQQPLQPQQGELNWRLSAHPITLLFFLGFRISALLMYLFGVLFIKNLCVNSFHFRFRDHSSLVLQFRNLPKLHNSDPSNQPS